ncbi:MAG: LysR family transcriptional regulator [Elusimicrobiales bacterium]|nr:LysR family transcriptional regulator [Elusimicrobiales bacterium]
MELRLLKYFVHAAREGNITRAAARLHVTQPTMSKQLKDLERELGQKLFIRSNYNIKLTEAGELLRKRAEDILELAQKTKEELRSADEAEHGDIYVGCAESDAMKHFAKAVRALQKKHPRITCHLHSGNEQDTAERLDKGLLDFAVITSSVNTAKYDFLELPFRDKWGLVLRKDHPFAQKKTVRLNDLFGLPLICSRQWLEQDSARWLGEDAKKLTVTATYNLAYNAAILARENIGCALTYDKLVNTGPDSPLCFLPLAGVPSPNMFVVWRKNQLFSRPARLLLDELKNKFA